MRKIVDSGTEIFAERVAQITVQEWYLFRELQKKKRELETEGKVRAFERIKPSMRKQLERRKKVVPLKDSEKFESYNERY